MKLWPGAEILEGGRGQHRVRPPAPRVCFSPGSPPGSKGGKVCWGQADVCPLPKHGTRLTARTTPTPPRPPQKPPEPPSPAPILSSLPSPKSQAQRKGSEWRRRAQSIPKQQAQEGAHGQGASGDAQKMLAWTETRAAQTKRCPPRWGAGRRSRTQGSYLQCLPQGLPAPLSFSRRAQAAGSAGRQRLCPAPTAPAPAPAPAAGGNGEEEWPRQHFLLQGMGMGPAALRCPSCPQPSAAAAGTALPSEAAGRRQGRGGAAPA